MELDKQTSRSLRTLSLPALVVSQEVRLAADFAACQRIMRAASKNYSFASRLLPADKASHVTALYAVMRVGDDLVDVDHAGFSSPRAAIEHWEASYWRAFEHGDSDHPVLRAYLHTAQTFGISPDLLRSYFRAMIDDLSVRRYPTFAELLHYMDGSAIPVGRIMTHILGTHRTHIPDTYPAADALAIAMQLSNFWRDIGEDWQRGRVYIPQEDLDRFGYGEADLAAGRIDERLAALLEFEFVRTEGYYRQAAQGVAWLAAGQWAVMSALKLYRAILPDIRRSGYDVFNRRAGTTRRQKIGLMFEAWRETRSWQ